MSMGTYSQTANKKMGFVASALITFFSFIAVTTNAHDPVCSEPSCSHQSCLDRRGHSSCCEKCGCQSSCHKICRLICEDKKVQEVCWGVECEDFCVPGPSTPGCEHCEKVCEPSNDPKEPCTASKNFIWKSWIPSMTTKIFTKKKLMKKTVTKTIPGYKWVVEDLCAACEKNSLSVTPEPNAKVPPKPTAEK